MGTIWWLANGRKMLNRPWGFKNWRRFMGENEDMGLGGKTKLRVERLKKRSLLTVEGEGAGEFLQSLMTNDIRLLETGATSSLFTMFLNSKGRIIHEAIVYKSANDGYILECDISATQALEMHLKMYMLKKRVEVRNVEDEVSVWAVFDPNFEPGTTDYSILENVYLGEGMLLVKDPRLEALGYRAIAPKTMDVTSAVRANGLEITKSSVPMYTTLRYKLGVGEGIEEIPYGKYLALEANGDYLHGICFDKSEYVGSNIMYVGSEGRRLMPVLFDSEPNFDLRVNSPMEDVLGRRKTPVGYLMGIQGQVGLGLVRVSDAVTSGAVKMGNLLARCVKPYWWPRMDNNTSRRRENNTNL